ncbi:FG-GAP repeat domain-containing protein [Azohydromonas lata]|uniref:FG-GAP repeat domain-containing protein n=1 Tax=Azohydromonas lata TaxID=45677 RepID=UPI0008372533|nr:VCBS repeat-containing protein [Azohydromonas lata]
MALNANTAPQFRNPGTTVSSLGGTVSYTEGAAAVALDTDAVVYDAELAALNGGIGCYAGASITLSRVGGASSEDVFSALGSLKFSAGRALLSNLDVGGLTNANGTLTITFNANATKANVSTVLESIGYANTSDAPPSKVDIGWTFKDGADATALSVSDHTYVTVTNVNDKPTGQVTVQGLPKYGFTLSAASTLDDADGLGELHFQWLRSGTTIVGATGSEYTLGQTDVGQRLSVRVSYVDGMGSAETAASAATAVVARAPVKDYVLWRETSTGNTKVLPDATTSNNVSTSTMAMDVQAVGMGDFNGDGTRDVLWRNVTTGKNFYWNNGNARGEDLPEQSNLSWQVTGVGDFNGDGRSDILWRQAYSGANAIWDSGSSSRTITAMTDLNWKVAGVGDFNADGRSDILWLNTVTADTTVWFSGDAAQAQQGYNTGNRGWRVAGIGDFDGDGRDDVFWRHTSGINYVWAGADGSRGYSVDWELTSSPVGVGDYNGDGRDDVLWSNAADRTSSIWDNADPSLAHKVYHPPGQYWTLPAQTNAAAQPARPTNDFDGDGLSDLVWRHGGEGNITVWSGAQGPWDVLPTREEHQSWKIVGIGDFDGDGRGDYFWRNVVTGDTSIWWRGNVEDNPAQGALTNLNFQVAGIGDFDGDGKSDVLWRNSITGANTVWYSGSSPKTIDGLTDTHNIVAGIGDFDGDGRSDILWRNTSNGGNTLWLGGTGPHVALAAEPRQGWRVAAVGDFDGDGRDDLFWRNTDGSNAIWSGANKSETHAVDAVADTKWQVMGVGDYNGDGRDDLFWRHDATGATRIWYSASTKTTQDSINVEDPYWQPVPQTQAAARPPMLPNADFTRDGHSDIFWRNTDTGETSIWPNGSAAWAYPTQSDAFTLNQNWVQVGLGDFNADGTSDVLWRNTATFEIKVWDNGIAAQSRTLPFSSTSADTRNANWLIAGIGDFNADGASDLFWHNDANNANIIWYSGIIQSQHLLGTQPSVAWQVAGVGDFNGDGSSDVLWRNSATGNNTVWENGYNGRATACDPVTDLGWRVAAMGDFTGDGRDDIFWRHDNGSVVVWNALTNPTPVNAAASPGANWKVVAVGDYNGDGRDDLFWRNAATGEDKIWDSADSTHAHAVDTVAEGSWQIQGQTNTWLF